jgi:hypothetical protein
LLITGYDFIFIWEKFGILPCAFAVPVSYYSSSIYWIGIIFSIFSILLTNTAVARLSFMTLRNELFYSWIMAFKFAFKKWVSISGALLTFIFLILGLIMGGLIMGLLGKIPFIGEIGIALFSLPLIFVSLILLFIITAFLVGLLLIPAIVALADEDALGIVFQSLSLTYNYPWQIIIYGFTIGILEIFSIFVFTFAIKLAYNIFIKLFSLSMGDQILSLKTNAIHIIDKFLPFLQGWIQQLPAGIGDFFYTNQYFNPATAVLDLPLISSLIFAVFILFSAGIVLAYGEAVGNAGLSIMYLVLHKKRMNENLLEHEDEELIEKNKEL